MLDRRGNIVRNKEDVYGCPPKYNLTHTEKLVFVDEVGVTTSQANDGKQTGTKYAAGNLWRAQQQNSFTYCSYATLGFTVVTGDPVMCAVIIAAKK
jgi:hypothetical protein